MLFKVINITILVLSLMIVEIIIASPIGQSMEVNENPLLDIALKSMNNNSPNNRTYWKGSVLKIRKISDKIVKVSVLLEANCIEESPCPREICDMLIKQDESNKLFVDDQSKECHYVRINSSFHDADSRSKRAVTELDAKDPIVKNYVKSASSKYAREYLNSGKPFITRIINATKEDVSDGFTYLIYYSIVEPQCTEENSIKACYIDDFSSTRLCTITADSKDKETSVFKTTTSTCENEPHAPDSQGLQY